MNYSVKELPNQGVFNVYLASNGKQEFTYWKRKTTNLVNQTIVVFDNKNANINLSDGSSVLSLSGINDFWELQNVIRFYMSQINKAQNSNIKFTFVVENENQRQVAEAIGYNLRVEYEVVKSNSYSNAINEVSNELENKNEISASGSKTLEVSDKKITVSDNKAYVNTGALSIDEQKKILLDEWLKDPFMSRRISSLSKEEIDRMLIENVTNNLKEYRMESSREQEARDKVGEAAIKIASGEDGLVNHELGIVQNDVSKVNGYSAVEQKGENVRVVNPNVVSSSINNSGVSSNYSGSSYDTYQYDESNIENNWEQSREALSEYYIDEEYNVYDNNGNIVGKIGNDNLMIDYNNNTLVKDGKSIGYVGDYNDMGKNNTNTYSKPKVKTLKKDEHKSAAFVSLPAIIFMISALLFIGSIILLFVLD